MKVIYANDRNSLDIGFAGEKNRTEVRFFYGDLEEEFPGGTVLLQVRRPGEGAKYDILLDAVPDEPFTASWTVSDYDCAIRGIGECQLVYGTTDNIAKRKVWRTYVDQSVEGTDASIPPDWEDVYNRFVAEAADIRSAISGAADFSSSASESALSAQSSASQAEQAATNSQNSASAALGYAQSAQASAASAAGLVSTYEALATTLGNEIGQIQSSIGSKLDAPSTSGTSGQVLTSNGQGGYSWQNPTGGSTVDTTLSVSGAAADSKTVGDALSLQSQGISSLQNSIGGKLDAPSTSGTSGQVLTSNGQGGQSWQNPTGGSTRGNADIFIGRCTTEASASEKEVACSDFDHYSNGDRIYVTFANAMNHASSGPGNTHNFSLNVNGKGAKPVKVRSGNTYMDISGPFSFVAERPYLFTYESTGSGGVWIVEGIDFVNQTPIYATDYKRYPVLLGDTVNSNSPSVGGVYRFGGLFVKGGQLYDGDNDPYLTALSLEQHINRFVPDFVEVSEIVQSQVWHDGDFVPIGIRIYPVDSNGNRVQLSHRVMNDIGLPNLCSISIMRRNNQNETDEIDARNVDASDDYPFGVTDGPYIEYVFAYPADGTVDVYAQIVLETGIKPYGLDTGFIEYHFSNNPTSGTMEIWDLYLDVSDLLSECYQIIPGSVSVTQATTYVAQTIARDYWEYVGNGYMLLDGVWYWQHGASSTNSEFRTYIPVIKPTFLIKGDRFYYANKNRLIQLNYIQE